MHQETETVLDENKLFTRDFFLLCLARLAFFGSMSLLLAVLPLYVIKIGGNKSDIGIVIGAFTIAVVIMSPFVGGAADEWGRKKLMIIGASIYVVAGILYNFAVSFPLLLMLRLFHGSGLGTFNPASSAYIADIAPIERRGEAIGYFGMVANVAMAIAPALGVVIVERFGFTVLFLIMAVTSCVAVASTFTLTDKYRPILRSSGQPRPSLFPRKAFFPSAVMVSLGVSYGAIVSFLVIFAIQNGVDNPGFFFTAYAIVLIVSRSVAGILSDRLGRKAVIIPGLMMAGIGIWILSFSTSMSMLLVVALIYGVGLGSVQPTLMAFTIDRIGLEGRGAALGTLGAAFDIGLSIGSIALGFILQYTNFFIMFSIAGVVPILGMIGFIVGNWWRQSHDQ